MPKAFLFTHRRYELYNLNVPRLAFPFSEESELPTPNIHNVGEQIGRDKDVQISVTELGAKDEPGANLMTCEIISSSTDEEDIKPSIPLTRKALLLGRKPGGVKLNSDEFLKNKRFAFSPPFTPRNGRPFGSVGCIPSPPPLVRIPPRESTFAHLEKVYSMDEEPVNLSMKKRESDLFENLTKLADVSLSTLNGRNESLDLEDLSISSAYSPGENSVTSSTFSSSSSSSSSPSSLPGAPPTPPDEIGQQGVEDDLGSRDPSRQHVCPECKKGFSTLSNLARHKQTHRSPSDSAAVKKCPHCAKIYVSVPAFSMHLRTHNQGCKCTYCGKGFSRPWLLQGHIRTHTGEKPFSCNICQKAFADKSNLRAHCQTHSTEKPWSCSRCLKSFALKSYLQKHVESSCMRSSGSTTTRQIKDFNSDSSMDHANSAESQNSSDSSA